MVSQQFNKHIFLTKFLNAHNHNTCIHLPSKQTGCSAQKMAFSITYQDRQTQILATHPSGKYNYKHNLGTVQLLQPKTKQSPIVQLGENGFPAPKCPNLIFESKQNQYNIRYTITIVVFINKIMCIQHSSEYNLLVIGYSGIPYHVMNNQSCKCMCNFVLFLFITEYEVF